MSRKKVLIVGYGRMGRLLASILQSDFHVGVLDSKRPRLRRAISRVTPSEIENYSIVLLALPIHRLEGFLHKERKRFSPGSFVADVSALKEAPMRWMRRHLPSTVSFCGLHPLLGPDSAGKGLSGHTVAVCPGRNTKQCHRRVILYLQKHGLKVVETDAITHDKIMASTLFLTQWVGAIFSPDLMMNTPPFENTNAALLRVVAGHSGHDQAHILRDLCHFSPHSRKMLRNLTRRSNATARQLSTIHRHRGH